ncbi:matrixin family metalloprotease [candidate division KSB1 bacterium]|nr:matrixin family metalloprotease [candidate division KSB1 bacterium]
MKRSIFFVSLAMVILLAFACGKKEPVSPESTQPQKPAVLAKEGDPAILAKMDEINAQLAAMGSNLFLNEIELFTIGLGRPNNRILQQPFRWVPDDPRRNADGDNITYLVDQSDGRTASGLTAVQTEAAIDRALVTWDNEVTCEGGDKLDIVKRQDPGQDPDIFDSFFGFGRFGDPFLADIVNAGWLPRAFFEAVGGPGGGRGILAFSVTFIFGTFDDQGNFIPSDINGDNYLDTALNEVYYNDTFGDRRDDRADRPWGINIAPPGIDVETVALHENGHSLGIGHFGPPPDAVMNPRYAGIRQALLDSDEAAYCINYSSWPNP